MEGDATVHTVIVKWIKQCNNLYGNYYEIAFKYLIKMTQQMTNV